jgi:hypothetical protein
MGEDEVGFGLVPLVLSQVLDYHSQDVVDDESDHSHEGSEEGGKDIVTRVFVLVDLVFQFGHEKRPSEGKGEHHKQYQISDEDVLASGGLLDAHVVPKDICWRGGELDLDGVIGPNKKEILAVTRVLSLDVVSEMLVLEGDEGTAHEMGQVESHRRILCKFLAQQYLLLIDEGDLSEYILEAVRILLLLHQLVPSCLLLLSSNSIHVLLHESTAHLPEDLHLGQIETHGHTGNLLQVSQALPFDCFEELSLDLLQGIFRLVGYLGHPAVQFRLEIFLQFLCIVEFDLVGIDHCGVDEQYGYAVEKERVIFLRMLG